MIRKQKRISKMSNYTFSLCDNSLNHLRTSHALIIPDRAEGLTNVCIIQPGCWGDNINSTLMLEPVKRKYPDSRIDIYTTDPYKSAFHYNPYIDNIISVNANGKNQCLNFMFTYDELLMHSYYDVKLNGSPLYNSGGWACKYNELGENLILSWANTLDKHYELPLKTIMLLSDDEKQRADSFFDQHTHGKNGPYILMEVEGESGQSFWNHDWTESVCNSLISQYSATIFISKRMKTGEITSLQHQHGDKIVFVGDLSIRECAQIFNRCDAFFSVSSGLSNACNTNWCKKNYIKWVEVTNSRACSSAPIRSNHKTFWHNNNLSEFLSKVVSTLFIN
jgi:hypothetical protein